MTTNLLFDNLTNPALLFFVLGIVSVWIKSDLEIPADASKFISLYLLFSIGFKGGQELAKSQISHDVVYAILLGVATAVVIPVYTFFILKRKLKIEDAGAIAAAYGSVSAVTFVTAGVFLENQHIKYGGHMVAIMAMMEAPAIIVGVLLIRFFTKDKGEHQHDIKDVIFHSFTNGSVLLILGSLVIGYIATEKQALDIKPFTTDIYKGFLAIFLLDMGIISGRKLGSLFAAGWFTAVFAIVIPLINGCLIAVISGAATHDIGNRLILSILAASASYIAVPAAMKIAVPKANPGLFLPMALALTFPFNITIGMPIYMTIIQHFK